MRVFYPALMAILLLTACGHSSLSHKFIMEPQGWDKFKTLTFSEDKFNNEKPYKISLNLVLNEKYREDNFTFQMIYESGEGESWNRAFTVEIKEEDKFIVRPEGGKMLYSKVLIPEKYLNAGKYNFEIVNLNPRIITAGIESLEIVFEQ